MKIAILGYSGCGKSTLAERLGALYCVEVFHFDSVQFLPGWKIRSMDEKQRMTEDFMNTHDGWIMDGNYSKLSQERRLSEADQIILMKFNRFACLYRVFRRYLRYRHTVRPDMAEGCQEKLDAEFVRWILWDGRSTKTRNHFREIETQYAPKVTVLRNQRQLDAFYRALTADNNTQGGKIC